MAERVLPPREGGGTRVLQVGVRRIGARQAMTITKTHVPLRPHVTYEMLASGKKREVLARKYRDADAILALFTLPDEKKDFVILRLDDHGQRISVRGHLRQMAAMRCAA